jgi:hypothetical protein
MAFASAIFAGLVIFQEGKAIKTVEGVPVSEEDLERLKSDKEKNVIHYNNIKDKATRRK